MSFSQEILTRPSRRSSDVDDLNLVLTSFIFENDLSVLQLETGNVTAILIAEYRCGNTLSKPVECNKLNI